ncbi:MAG TPA: phosphoribosylamine--glycine ligase [Anaeromyxobacteraceae bacterium]|nr:phosphoribosylamine--glycine ligase [Anaeromyxobacteraceae bacterium]
MRVLVVGSGGREHALAWKIAQSPLLRELWCAPGNPGILRLARAAPVEPGDLEGLAGWAAQSRVDLVVVGPEAPLVLGLADRCQAAGVPVFGPSAAAAEIEGSKAFAKDVMRAAGIPTAGYQVFSAVEPALAFARARAGQVVVKADGLAAGKGVVVCGAVEEAEAALKSILVDRVHGAAGAAVVVEERLSGPEASCIAFTDGERVRLLPSAQDHKRIFDGDRGPNTGGMGAFSPSPSVTPEVERLVEERVLLPAVREMGRRGRPFRGALYAGLMLTAEGLRVLEFNARLGDPETQPILLKMQSDILPVLLGAARGNLAGAQMTFDGRAAVGVVLAAESYPGKPVTGDAIEGAEGDFPAGVQVFQAGTARSPDGRLLTAGGRVLTACALGETLEAATELAYQAAARIHFRGCQYRTDIGRRGGRGQGKESA